MHAQSSDFRIMLIALVLIIALGFVATDVASADSSQITASDLVGSWETHFKNSVTNDKARIDKKWGHFVTGKINITNQFNQVGVGTFNTKSLKITVTGGNWPDVTKSHPMYGTVSRIAGGRLRIDWSDLLEINGGTSGGYWLKEAN